MICRQLLTIFARWCGTLANRFTLTNVTNSILLQAERGAQTRARHQEEEQSRPEGRSRAQCTSNSGPGHKRYWWYGRCDRGGVLRSSPRRGHHSHRPHGPCTAVHRAEPQQTVPASGGGHGLHIPHSRATESDPLGYGRQRQVSLQTPPYCMLSSCRSCMNML